MNGSVAGISRSLLIAALTLAAAIPCQAQSNSTDEKTFVQLQHDWAEARKKADVSFLEKFYAPEFTVGNMNGSESTRAQDISMFSSGDLKPAVITDDQLKVYRFGKAAMVTGVEHLEGTYKNHPGKFDLRFANVFVYRDGRWQIVRHQATPIQK